MSQPEKKIEDPDHLVLQPRDVRFDWGRTPAHWIPGEVLLAHILNVTHMILPEIERWFIRVFSAALPLISSEKVRADVRGFIGQESVHAESHQGAADHLTRHGIDVTPFTGQMEWVFQERLLRPELKGTRARKWLIWQLSGVAAGEHFTAMLGEYILANRKLDEVGADPVMLDLFRWHGAEEVEHRAVAFDLFTHLDNRYWARVITMVAIIPPLIWLFIRGTLFLYRNDPHLPPGSRPRMRELIRLLREGLLPPVMWLIKGTLKYLRRDFHPSQVGSTSAALEYLATSPAARAANH
ncbi:metal-dependent hydrolase [Pseudonocardiaceae bacterium YIM PH 21723]|nr:metal-dependent hydrolase [Pseudonocardiaceae bacterium YIM PH 21723]